MSSYPPSGNSGSEPAAPIPGQPVDGDVTVGDWVDSAVQGPPPIQSSHDGDATVADTPTIGRSQSDWPGHGNAGDVTIAEGGPYQPPTNAHAPSFGSMDGDATLAEFPSANRSMDAFAADKFVQAGDATIHEYGSAQPSQDATMPELAPPSPSFGWSASQPQPNAGDVTHAEYMPGHPPANTEMPPIPVPIQPMAPPSTFNDQIIPVKNVPALMGYYAAVFSVIPCLGLPCGLAGLICGLIGLKKIKENPMLPGKVHAWIGILLGGLMFLAQAIGITIILVAISQQSN